MSVSPIQSWKTEDNYTHARCVLAHRTPNLGQMVSRILARNKVRAPRNIEYYPRGRNDCINTAMSGSEKVDRGRCLCGAVTFEVTGSPIYNVVCHCTNCKRAGGSTFHTACIFPAEKYKLLTGADKITVYNDYDTQSGKALYRSFCSVCGSGITANTALNSNIVSVPAGVMETAGLDFVPHKEQFRKDRVDWVPELDVVKDDQKTDLGPVVDTVSKIQ